MMEPRPEGAQEEPEDQEEEEEEEEEEQDEVEHELEFEDEDESDTDTVQTTDTNQTAETTDSLFENVKFPKEEEEDVESQGQKSKPKIDLRDLVKQDLKGIVTSVDYFDEQKS